MWTQATIGLVGVGSYAATLYIIADMLMTAFGR
jgi:hypothetical protein